MPEEFKFPVSDYYRDTIIDARTISRAGGWWTAVLVIEDPKNGKPFINLYRWQKRGDDWKTRKNFKVNSRKLLLALIGSLEEMGEHLQE